MFYFVFFLLGVISSGVFCYFYFRRIAQENSIAEMLLVRYQARKNFDKAVTQRLSEELFLKTMTVKSLELENDKLRTEKLKKWGIPDKL